MGDLNICPEGENVLSTPNPSCASAAACPGGWSSTGRLGDWKAVAHRLGPLEGLVSLGLILSLAKFLP